MSGESSMISETQLYYDKSKTYHLLFRKYILD